MTQIKNIIKQFAQLLVYALPKSKKELLFLFGVFIFYFSYSLIFLHDTIIIDSKEILFDVYMGFDSLPFFHKGTNSPGKHFLMKYMTMPFFWLANTLSSLTGKEVRGILWCALTSLCISSNIMYVKRYLADIIELNRTYIYLIITFYIFFFTNLILAFTTESYPISIALLSFSVCYYSMLIKKNEKISIFNATILSCLLGGVTISNFVKGIIPILFEKNDFKKNIIKCLAVSLLFCIFFSIVVIFANSFIFYDIKLAIHLFTSEYNLHGTPTEYYEKVIDLFLGAPILYSGTIVNHFPDLPSYVAKYQLNVDTYHHLYQYLFTGILYIFILYSIIKNIKNRFVLILISLFFCDIFIHIICGFGLVEGFLYAGHWVYIIPLLIGWGFKKIGHHKKLLLIISLTMLLILIINNTTKLIGFYQLAADYYPASLNG